jgi:hypothetical protein
VSKLSLLFSENCKRLSDAERQAIQEEANRLAEQTERFTFLFIAQELADAAELAQTPHGKEFPVR